MDAGSSPAASTTSRPPPPGLATQLLPCIGYPRTLNALQIIDDVTLKTTDQ